MLVASHCAASLLQGLSPLEYDVARGVPINIGGGGSMSFFHDELEVCSAITHTRQFVTHHPLLDMLL